MKKLQKPKTLRVLCVVFRSLKKTRKSVCTLFTTVCNSSLTYTTYKPSHRSHTIIPLSNHHTIIILKSFELRNICIHIFILFLPLLRSIYSSLPLTFYFTNLPSRNALVISTFIFLFACVNKTLSTALPSFLSSRSSPTPSSSPLAAS